MPGSGLGRRALPLFLALLLAGCAAHLAPPGPATEAARVADEAFVMPDGARLPYHAWLPAGAPRAVVLALHGMNDSRDAWELPGPAMAEHGVAVFAPDQRGFGATATRGLWPGGAGLTADAAAMAGLLRDRYPNAKLFGMGESMGAAVWMVTATRPVPPPVDGYILLAPAVRGRAALGFVPRATLAIMSRLVPGLSIGRVPGLRIRASDNDEALRRLSRDPLTLKRTRVDAVAGLVDLMDAARQSASRLPTDTLVLYGAHDELVPPDAMRAAWTALPSGVRRGFYDRGWHLLLRDRARADVTQDVLAWIEAPDAKLPSGADDAARGWIARTD